MVRSFRRFSIDPRLLIGIGLVVASVAGVVAVVSTSDRTVQVLSARAPLAPGDRVGSDDLVVVEMRPGEVAHHYLSPADVPADGVVVTRFIGEGDLIPVDAVGSSAGLRLASVVLDIDGPLAESARPGGVVDVWAARQVDGGGFAPPSVIVSGATIVRLIESDSLTSDAATTGVEVLVPTGRVARVLDALANEAAVSLVPSSIPVR